MDKGTDKNTGKDTDTDKNTDTDCAAVPIVPYGLPVTHHSTSSNGDINL
jgi:hypothetical protein